MPSSAAENKFLSELAYNERNVVLRNGPELLGIESTNHCNIKCIMCPRGEPDVMKRPVGHMPVSTLERVVEQAEFFSDPTWLHWFGEPLMNPSLFEQIKIAKKKVPNLGISTNATLLRPAEQRKILDSKLDSIIIAIDGATKEVYESVRKSERFTFEQVTANAEQFLALRRQLGLNRPHVTLSIIVMDMTAPDLDQFREYWTGRGADQVLFKPYSNWAGQYAEVFTNLQVEEKRETLRSPRPNPCKLLWESALVTWDGKVVPCCYDYDAKMVLGDLKTQTMDEIWNGPAYTALRKAELEGRNHSELCANCSQAPGHQRDQHWYDGRVNMRPEFGWAPVDPSLPSALEIGTTIFAETAGLHPVEIFEGRPLRWTNGTAKIVVPVNGRAPTRLAIDLANMRGTQLIVRIDGDQVFDGALPGNGLQQTFALSTVGRQIEIDIDSDSFRVPGDARTLGVAVRSICLLS